MPIFPEHRPIYKISQILLILCMSSRGGKSSLIRLHLINWALKKEERKRVLIESVKREVVDFGVWGIDPSLNYALQYGVADHLLENTNSGYRVTEKGRLFFKDKSLPSIMKEESYFLTELGFRLTESMVEEVAKGWG